MKMRIGFVGNSSSSSFVVLLNSFQLPTFKEFSARCKDDMKRRCALTVYRHIRSNYNEDFPIYSRLSISERKKNFYKLFFVNNEFKFRDALYHNILYPLCDKLSTNMNPSMFPSFENYFDYLVRLFGYREKSVLEKLKPEFESFFDKCNKNSIHFNSRYCGVFDIIDDYCFSHSKKNQVEIPLLTRHRQYKHFYRYLVYKHEFKELMNSIDFSKTWFTVLEYEDDTEDGSYIEHNLFHNDLDIRYYRVSNH